jgi:hypothetical protein
VLKAYIAPHETDEGFRFSAFLDDLAGIHENSPEFETLPEAVTWALERTDFVIARQSIGPYYWYGRGHKPSDIEPPPTRGMNQTD